MQYGIIFRRDRYAPVAQPVEHLTFNQGVRDSNSRRSTKQKAPSRVLFCLVPWRRESRRRRRGIRNIAPRLAYSKLFGFFLLCFHIIKYTSIAIRGNSIPTSIPSFIPTCSTLSDNFEASSIPHEDSRTASVTTPTS